MADRPKIEVPDPLADFPGDSEAEKKLERVEKNPPRQPKDTPQQDQEVRSDLVKGKPIGRSFKEIVEHVVGEKVDFSERPNAAGDIVILCRCGRAEGSVLKDFLAERVRSKRFNTFVEGFALDLKRGI